ncbi:protein unc-45 homolog A-like [Suncus etruscus]|uniref:protein unc-45 homolog A-like n=1 Tax=Suncus etruscus TaxID=109475 RepID=UPI0021103067|nr:protein unc-45 homolog A-like [Suncus etruscus]
MRPLGSPGPGQAWLCSSGGTTDFSMKQLVEGSTLKLAKHIGRNRCKHLAYLTFDADVKEEFVMDEAPLRALRALFQLSKSDEQSVLFATASVLVNCTNSYVYEEPDPKMVELAKYAKFYLPHNKPSFLRACVVSMPMCMVKINSPVLTNTFQDLLSRVFLALVENMEDQGTMEVQSGSNALLPLALEGTDVGQTKAIQALAKLTITSSPEKTFPRGPVCGTADGLELIWCPRCVILQNFEALMELTNLMGISEQLWQKILKVPMIQDYMFKELEMIHCTATKFMSNVAMSKEVQKLFEAMGNDQLKLLVLDSGEDDELLWRAAAGGLAMLTSMQPSLCSHIPEVTTCKPHTLQPLLLRLNLELQHRAHWWCQTWQEAYRELAGSLVENDILKILFMLAKAKEKGPFTKEAIACLGKAREYGLMKPNEGGE